MAAKKPDDIAASLISRIVGGELARLPREGDLAEDYGVSKGTVREARRVLADRGLVQVEQGRAGATIRPVGEWSLYELPVLEAVLAGPERERLVAEALEHRRLLEPHAAALAAERAGEAELAALDAALAQMRAAARHPARSFPGVEGRRAAERAFQRGVLDAAGNRFLTRALLSLAHVTAARPRAVAVSRWLAEHAEIRDAIRARDAERASSAALARLR